MKLAALLVFSVTLYAQTTTAPTTFYAFGVSAYTQSSPKPTGWAVVATELNEKAQVWSFSETDYTKTISGTIQTSIRSGLATTCAIGSISIKIFCLADAGVATTGTASGGAYAGGAVALVPVGSKGFYFLPGVRALKTSATGVEIVVELGIGWGKK